MFCAGIRTVNILAPTVAILKKDKAKFKAAFKEIPIYTLL
jgi:hypothetical protein